MTTVATPAPVLDCTQTVNEITLRHPATLAVFSAFGVDTCCGGKHPVEEVVRRHGLDGQALCAALSAAIAAA